MTRYLMACLVLLVSCSLPHAYAQSGDLVQFESAPVKPTKFQQQRAKATGKTLVIPPGTPIRGYLVAPKGSGPFPAVVVLHGCSGITRGIEGVWSDRLASWGYVALVVDSLTTRGLKETCTKSISRWQDAYGALEFLSRLPIVDPGRVVLMGFSDGGRATLWAVALGGVEVLMDRKFKAAVAFYPPCSRSSGNMSLTTLILVGDLDDWTPAKDCQKMMSQRNGEGSPVVLVIYPGAHHAFVSADLQPGLQVFGHRIEYNEVAARRSVEDVQAFLLEAIQR